MTLDMSKYLGVFVSEGTEHLESLARDLVAFEKSPGAEVVDSMFRHAHSIKGMAASMGYEPIAVVAHRVEDLVGAMRDTPARLDRAQIDLLLGAVDLLLGQVRAVGAGLAPEEGKAILAELGARVEALTGQAPKQTRVLKTTASANEPSAAPEVTTPSVHTGPAQPESKQVDDRALGLTPRWQLRFKLAATCQVPGVRAFLVHKRLTSLGTVVEIRPALEELRAGRIPDGVIAAELESSSAEEALSAQLKNIPEVELTSIKRAEAPSPAAPVLPNPAAAQVSSPASAIPVPVSGPTDSSRTVRVKTELLDYFLDAVGELLLATARIREVGKSLPTSHSAPWEEAVYRLHGLVKDLHDKVMTVRMTPLSLITERLPRAVRDIARKTGREVEFAVSGAEIELDRAIIDELSDPLLHLLRNCVDHGIEPPAERIAAQKSPQGRLLLTVRRQRDRVLLELQDDGRGMDPSKLKAAAIQRGALTPEAAARMTDKEALLLACLPGVSTAKDVSDISGRGVGMDAVKRSIEAVNGTLEIESERGRGTRFTLRLPLTVAVVNLLLVGVREEIFGLPIAKVLGAVEWDSAALSGSRGTALLPYGQAWVPVHELSELLNLDSPRDGLSRGTRPYVVMEGDAGKVALAVDRLLGQEEVVLKALSRPLDLVPGLSGVTILGTGRPVFILDVPRLTAI